MKLTKTALLLSLSVMFSLAMAGEIKPFNQQVFDKLTADGKPVVLDISATWCPTCKAQKTIIESLMKQPAYKDVTLLAVDFDTDKPTVKKFASSEESVGEFWLRQPAEHVI